MYKIKVEYFASREEKLGVMFGAWIKVIDYDLDLDIHVLPNLIVNYTKDQIAYYTIDRIVYGGELKGCVKTPELKDINMLKDLIENTYMNLVKKIIMGKRSKRLSKLKIPSPEIFEF